MKIEIEGSYQDRVRKNRKIIIGDKQVTEAELLKNKDLSLEFAQAYPDEAFKLYNRIFNKDDRATLGKALANTYAGRHRFGNSPEAGYIIQANHIASELGLKGFQYLNEPLARDYEQQTWTLPGKPNAMR